MALRRGFRVFSVCLAAVLAAYFLWARHDRVRPPLDVRLQLESHVEVDTFRSRGNIIGVSPWMVPTDYASRQHLMNKLDGYLQVAKTLGWMHEGTVVVFPEHIGTWLIVEGEKAGIFRTTTIDDALALFVGSNYFYYLREWFTAPDGTVSRTRHSIFSIKSASMARSYQEVFGSLARKYGVTIVAGSILLSNPSVRDSVLQTDMGPLSNVGAVFHSDGHIDPRLYGEEHPGTLEGEFVRGVSHNAHPVFDLPAGPTTVLISEDAWRQEGYAGVSGRDAIVIVPEFFSADSALSKPWSRTGLSNREKAQEALSRSAPTLSEAILRYGMTAKVSASPSLLGMLVPLRGRLWDLGSDGGIIAAGKAGLHVGENLKGATMMNLNLR
ncbi:MAG: hypothetical protein EBZ67_08695 [Chitinophagia bacterium]|nr:hypothetical protein [Chitinophagia bacterium]